MKLAYLYPEHLGLSQARVLQTAATVRALARQGAEVHFLVGRYDGLTERLNQLGLTDEPGVVVEGIAMMQPGPGSRAPISWHGLYHLSALGRIKALKRQGLQVIMARHLKTARAVINLRTELGLPILYEAHELFVHTAVEEGLKPVKLAKLALLEDAVLKGADRVVAISKPLAAALAEKPELPDEIAVAPSGVGEEFFEVAGDDRDPTLVAYAGGLGQWKGVDLLFEAVAKLPQARLEVLGGDPSDMSWKRLNMLAQQLALGSRLKLRPAVGQDAVRELLGRTGVAVWPGTARQRIAREFTSPLKLFEYLAAGCAVVAPDVPAASAVLTPDRDAVLFTPDDADSLAEVLAGLLADPAKCRELGRAGRELAKRYTWEERARVLLEVMEEMAA